MAPPPEPSSTGPQSQQLFVPSNSIGRLIGAKGVTIQELQTRTNTRVRVAAHSGGVGRGGGGGSSSTSKEADRGKEEDLGKEKSQSSNSQKKQQQQQQQKSTTVGVSVWCNAGSPSERAAAEARCRRAVELICHDWLSLDDALKQVGEEAAQQERFEAEQREMEVIEEEAGRLLVDGPEFDGRRCSFEDAKAALVETAMDPDAAYRLLIEGFRAPHPAMMVVDAEEENGVEHEQCQRRTATTEMQAAKKLAPEEPKEEFPALPLSSGGVGTKTGAAAASLCARLAYKRAAAGRKEAPPTSIENFPGLPAPQGKPKSVPLALLAQRERTRTLRRAALSLRKRA